MIKNHYKDIKQLITIHQPITTNYRVMTVDFFCLCPVVHFEPVVSIHIDKPKPVIRITDVNIKFIIINDSAEVEVNQTFKNDSQEIIECVYYYPLDADSAVRCFEAKFDGKTIKGICMEKQEARKTYDKAIKEGKSASLMEELSADVGKITVGNVKSRSEVVIKFIYIQTLKNNRFALPAVIGQKFCRIDPNTLESGSENGHSIINKVKITGEIMMLDDIDHIQDEAISNVSIKISDPHRATIDFYDVFDKDISLRIMTKSSESLGSSDVKLFQVSDSDKNDGCVMLSFVPEIPKHIPLKPINNPNLEVIFIVDRSGSMSGSRIDKVKIVLEKMLKRLRDEHPRSSFNIISFGNNSTSFVPNYRLKECDQDNIELAMEHIKNITANMGGTEISKPIEHAMTDNITKNSNRNIILLTDGEVNSYEDILNNIRNSPYRNNLRFFTLGIGSGVSSGFIKHIAHIGSGLYDFVHDSDTNFAFNPIVKSVNQPTNQNVTVIPRFVGDQSAITNSSQTIDDISSTKSWSHKMNRFYNAIFTPRITNFKISTNMTFFKTYPQDILENPNMNFGERFYFFALTNSLNSSSNYIELSYDVDNEPFVKHFKLDYNDKSYVLPDGLTLHCMTVQHLKSDLKNDELLKLSLKYNLMSKMTSFVAVDKEEFVNLNAKEPMRVDIESNISSSLSGIMNCFSIRPTNFSSSSLSSSSGHYGVNTIGSSLRNASLDLRSRGFRDARNVGSNSQLESFIQTQSSTFKSSSSSSSGKKEESKKMESVKEDCDDEDIGFDIFDNNSIQPDLNLKSLDPKNPINPINPTNLINPPISVGDLISERLKLNRALDNLCKLDLFSDSDFDQISKLLVDHVLFLEKLITYMQSVAQPNYALSYEALTHIKTMQQNFKNYDLDGLKNEINKLREITDKIVIVYDS